MQVIGENNVLETWERRQFEVDLSENETEYWPGKYIKIARHCQGVTWGSQFGCWILPSFLWQAPSSLRQDGYLFFMAYILLP